jgi:hypothetical protein
MKHSGFSQAFLFSCVCYCTFCEAQHVTDKQQLSFRSYLAIPDRAEFFNNDCLIQISICTGLQLWHCVSWIFPMLYILLPHVCPSFSFEVQKSQQFLQDFRLPLHCSWNICSSEMLVVVGYFWKTHQSQNTGSQKPSYATQHPSRVKTSKTSCLNFSKQPCLNPLKHFQVHFKSVKLLLVNITTTVVILKIRQVCMLDRNVYCLEEDVDGCMHGTYFCAVTTEIVLEFSAHPLDCLSMCERWWLTSTTFKINQRSTCICNIFIF